jgi:hypothetical protein
MSTYTIPPGAVGLRGRPAAFLRLELELGQLPPTWTLRADDGEEIRLFRWPSTTPPAGTLHGLTVLPAGTEIPT